MICLLFSLILMLLLILLLVTMLLQQFNSFAPISEQEVAEHFNGEKLWNSVKCSPSSIFYKMSYIPFCIVWLFFTLFFARLCSNRRSSSWIFLRNEISGSSAFSFQVFSSHFHNSCGLPLDHHWATMDILWLFFYH